MYVFASYVYVVSREVRRGHENSLKLELQVVTSHYVGAGRAANALNY